MNKQLNGESFRVTLTECIQESNKNLFSQPYRVKFRCNVNDDPFQEVLTYQEIMDNLNNDQDTQIYWKFK